MSFNPYKLLLELIPKSDLIIGIVQKISNGVATINVDGGGIIKARCSDTIKIGDKVFVKDNNVESKAPNTPLSVIEI